FSVISSKKKSTTFAASFCDSSAWVEIDFTNSILNLPMHDLGFQILIVTLKRNVFITICQSIIKIKTILDLHQFSTGNLQWRK
ncbi:hypothetical protein B5V90_20835, partial [Heyndrickxia sporothermodurans]